MSTRVSTLSSAPSNVLTTGAAPATLAAPAAAPMAGRGAGRRVIVLGSTGSIGTQTLDVIAHLNRLHERGEWATPLRVVGLAAGRQAELLHEQAARFGVQDVALGGGADAAAASGALGATREPIRVRTGPGAAERLVREVECDVVVAAMVGASGLPATLAAVELGRDVALANKETLVVAGELVVPAARGSGSRLLPVDSEHSAIWQCLLGHEASGLVAPPIGAPACVRRLILTASGGALRHLSREEAYAATPEQALKHPTWSMGAKVTIDSASLTNKAFEIIEAHWLFGVGADRIEAIIHPQSIVHSMVEFADGSLIAQLGSPDMRGPIQFALTFPQRPEGACRRLDLASMAKLEFTPPEPGRYPALEVAYRCIREGGTAGAVFNAAGEEAVAAFLAQRVAPSGAGGVMPFGLIGEVAHEALAAVGVSPLRDLADVLAADAEARAFVRRRLGAWAAGAQRDEEAGPPGAAG